MKHLSPALQSLAPISCRITDLRGKEVRLSKAGYVLRPGRSYHLRIVLPVGDANTSDVRLQAKPSYIEVARTETKPEEAGHAVRIIPFHIQVGGLLRFKQYVHLDSNDLPVAFTMTQGKSSKDGHQLCPIIVEPLLGPIILSAIVSLVLIIVQNLVGRLLDPGKPLWDGILGFFRDLLMNPESLIFFGLLVAGLSCLMLLVHLGQRKARERELWLRFKETYSWN